MNGQRAGVLIAMGLAVRLAVVAIAIVVLLTQPVREGYLRRFDQLAAAPGRPYLDFPVEYPPLLYWTIELVAAGSLRATALATVGLCAGLDLLTAGSLAKGWGREAAARYLILGTPLLAFLYLGLDLVPLALAVVGFYLALREREVAGGAVAAAGAFAKVWPVVLLPGLLIRGQRRAFAAAVVSLAVGALVWGAWSGLEGFRQVATQRDTPGWEVESTVGTLVWTLTGGPVGIVNDSPRVGTAPTWAKAGLAVLAAGWIGAIWLRSQRPWGVAWAVGACSSVAALLACSPILSYPFVLYLTPWAAIAASEGNRTSFRLALVATLLTGVAHASYGAGLPLTHPGLVRSVLLVRNGAIITLGALPFISSRQRHPGPLPRGVA